MPHSPLGMQQEAESPPVRPLALSRSPQNLPTALCTPSHVPTEGTGKAG